MGKRKWDELEERGIKFSHCWPNPGVGRYWKRLLNKARRKSARLECRGIRAKEHAGLEGEVAWKTW